MTFAAFPLGAVLAMAAATAAAVVALYLLRTAPRPRIVSNVEFWARAIERARPRWLFSTRLPLLSLLLSLLVALLLVALIGDPRFGAGVRGTTVVVLDAGRSMGAVGVDGQRRLDRALRDLESHLEQATSHGEVVLLRAGMRPSVLLPPTGRPADVQRALRALALDDGASDLGAAVALAETILDDRGEIASGMGRIVLVTDQPFEPAAARAPVLVLPVGSPAETLAITGFAARRLPGAVGEYVVRCEITAFTSGAARARLLVRDGEVTILDERVQVPAHQSVTVEAAGFSSARAELVAELREVTIDGASDGLAVDDRAYAVLEPVETRRVLLVSDGDAYLEAALAAHPGLDVEVVGGAAFASWRAEDLGRYHALVLDETALPAGVEHPAVIAFSPPAGGSVRIGASIVGPPISATLASHPVLDGLRLDGMRLEQARPIVAGPGDHVLVRSGERALAIARERAGARAVIFGWAPGESDLVRGEGFPLLVHHALHWVTDRAEPTPLPRRLGAALLAERGQSVRDPDGRTVPEPEAGVVAEVARAGIWHVGEGAIAFGGTEQAREPGAGATGGRFALPSSVPPLGHLLAAALLVLLLVEAWMHRDRTKPSGRAIARAPTWMFSWLRVVFAMLRDPARLGVLALVLLALLDVRISRPTDELAVAAVIDPSPSISPAERSALAAEIARLQAARPEVAMQIVGQHERAARPGRGADVAAELSVAVARLPRERVRRVLLATDGRDPGGDLPAAVAAARRAGVQVSVLPLGDSPPVDGVALSGLSVPRLVRAEETLDVGATIHAAQARVARMSAYLDGQRVATSEVELAAGRSSARIPVRFPDDPGVHELEVVLEADGDPIVQNNRWRALVEVQPRPRVRIYHDASRPAPVLGRVLRDAGMQVDVAPPQAAFTSAADYEPYALVVADEIDLGDVSEPQQRALRRWVEDGGGLVTVTGANPVRRTPRILREIEPVEPPPALPEPRPLELILVIDHSSSMSGYPMEAARRAGVAAVRALRRDALVGAVGFSGAADMLQPPVPMDQAQTVIQFIQRMQATGGTNIAAAIQAANRLMSHDPRYIHHVILVSDGESEPQSAIAAAMALAGRGVSISTITIGPYAPLLAEIARIGRGRYHTTSAAGLSSLVVSEAMYRQPPAHRQAAFRPHEQTHLAMLDGISFESAPPLGGHALAAARPGATVALTATEGAPLLAHWHRGLGQVATFTSATSGRWADAFRTWPGFRAFWAALARGMLRQRTVEPPRLLVERDPLRDDVRVLTVISPFAAPEPAPIARLFRGRGAPEPLALVARGPGVWQAELTVGAGFLVDARLPVDPDPTAAAGDERPYPEALRAFGPDRPMLERLAAIGAGRLLETPAAVLEQPGRAEVDWPLRTPLLVAALLSYLVMLLLQRLPLRRRAGIERPSRLPVPARGRPLGAAPVPTANEEAA